MTSEAQAAIDEHKEVWEEPLRRPRPDEPGLRLRASRPRMPSARERPLAATRSVREGRLTGDGTSGEQRATGQIHIRRLEARCILGVSDRERRRRTRVEFDLVLDVQLARACRSDSLTDAVDYRALKNRILDHVAGTRFHLVEALAASVAELCITTPGILRADVTVDKPGALTGAQSVAVRLVRVRRS